MDEKEIKKLVREGYSKIVKQHSSCCSSANWSCKRADRVQKLSKKIGYTGEEIRSVPESANLGLGCGNPIALASLKEGEKVLDLGCGAGFDCFLAARKVGENGKVIGVDMTPEMIEKARENAIKGNYGNVEFRLGEIENLPVADKFVDAVISNCVINLVPDKRGVFAETFRVLKPGGRLMISDLVLLRDLPDAIKNSVEAYVGCISGAMLRDEYIRVIKAAGFEEVRIINEAVFALNYTTNDQTAKATDESTKIPLEELENLANSVVSIMVHAVKPN
ncbi:MAG: arsenite methyltransferase [Candidatus Bathyarchaeota archaeon]|nr:arsenite methyltransferase [Candidatus Bathyarchaeota archaeon]